MNVYELIDILSDLCLDDAQVYGDNFSITEVRLAEDEEGRKIVIISEE
ncbi:hypothetical protein [Fluviispira vulneris]|nr:hypothetical protein [Fluviispira vulneris]